MKWPRSLNIDLAVPYQGNQTRSENITINGLRTFQDTKGNTDVVSVPGVLDWNGLTVVARLTGDAPSRSSFMIPPLNERANLPMELARQTGFVPLRRGFSRPSYSLSSVTTSLASEDEVASLLASDRFAQYGIGGYVEKIAGRRIQTVSLTVTSMFYIDSTPTGIGVPSSLVNEGFGINQLVYMLTICLYSRYKIVAIEDQKSTSTPPWSANLPSHWPRLPWRRTAA